MPTEEWNISESCRNRSLVEIMKGKGLHYNDLSFIVNRSGEDYPVLGTMLGSLPHKERNGKGVYLSLSEREVPQSPEGYVLQVSEKESSSLQADRPACFTAVRH